MATFDFLEWLNIMFLQTYSESNPPKQATKLNKQLDNNLEITTHQKRIWRLQYCACFLGGVYDTVAYIHTVTKAWITNKILLCSGWVDYIHMQFKKILTT